MRTQRIYVDTSVIGGCLNDVFKEPSIRLFEAFKSRKAVLVVSDLTLLELERAPAKVREVLDQVAEESIEYLEFTKEAAELAAHYLKEGVVENAMLVDAQHIAIATINRVDVLVSWNFKHIVNLARIRGFNSVNLRMGYALIEVRSPLELVPYE